VIITCEKCDTRFQLDDARVPDDGIKVRCSRCKHAFLVKRVDLDEGSDGYAAADLAGEALGGPPPDASTQNLESALDDTRTALLGNSGGELGPRRVGDAEGDEESDWQFNEEPRTPEPEAAQQPAAPPADPMNEIFGGDPPEPTPSLEDVGNPEDWNLLGEQSSEEVTGTDEAFAPSPEVLDEPTPVAANAAAQASAAQAAAAPAPRTQEAAVEPGRLDEPAETPFGRVATGAAWLVVGLALVVAVRTSFFAGVESTDVGPGAVELAGLRVEDARGRIVENAVAGYLLVVTATLRNPESEPLLPRGPLRVQLVDAEGTPLAQAAPLGPAPPLAVLRGEPVAQLDERLAGGASQLAELPLAPGEGLAVAAVFELPPAEARGFRFAVGERVSPAASPPTPPPSEE
jgi:predicted Zn finger-like uncharacterized protein